MNARNDSAQLDIVSDVICPWCYIGKERLRSALAQLDDSVSLNVNWRPYELNPSMPRGGIDRNAYYSAKFGSPEAARQLIDNITANAHNDGLEMDYSRITRVPNTIQAHRLIWFAERHECQDAVVDGLFRAYFVDGEDIEDTAVLARIGTAAGIEAAAVGAFLASEEGADFVRSEAQAAYGAGIQGVPGFLLNGHYLFSGAQTPDTIALSIKRAIAKGL